MNGFGRRLPRMLLSSRRAYSTSVGDIFNPTPDHEALRQMVSNFVVNEVEPQAQEHDRLEKFNMELFKKCGELGLLGITADGEYGGSHMDAVAACIVHEEVLARPANRNTLMLVASNKHMHWLYCCKEASDVGKTKETVGGGG